MAINSFLFSSPGDVQSDLIGNDIDIGTDNPATITPTRLVHRVKSQGGSSLTTINVPYPGFVGPLFLVASGHSLTLDAGGNIASGTSIFDGGGVVLIYIEKDALWYILGAYD